MNRAQSAQHRPDQGIWHAQELQDDSGHDAINQIHQRLHQQLAADPAAGLIERAGRYRELAVADEANQPVAQIPALEQHEDGHGHDQSRGTKRAYQRTQPGEAGNAGDGL